MLSSPVSISGMSFIVAFPIGSDAVARRHRRVTTPVSYVWWGLGLGEGEFGVPMAACSIWLMIGLVGKSCW